MEKKNEKKKMTKTQKIILWTSVAVVVCAGGYFGYRYREDLTKGVKKMFGKKTAEEQPREERVGVDIIVVEKPANQPTAETETNEKHGRRWRNRHRPFRQNQN